MVLLALTGIERNLVNFSRLSMTGIFLLHVQSGHLALISRYISLAVYLSNFLPELVCNNSSIIQGPNILLDDTLPTEVDKNLLNAVKDSIVQG